jgi:zinc transporter, ZIP family
MDVGAPVVLLAALATALATGLGALPFLAVRRPSRSWLGVSNAIAAGFMLAASAVLVWEGGSRGITGTVVGALLGVVAIAVARRLIGGHEHLQVGALQGADASKAVLIVGVMTVHSFAEGVAVGVSFGGGSDLGIFIAIAIAVHNIPEGVAISLVLVPRGASVAAAAGWSIVSSLPQPLMALPAFAFVEVFEPLLPYGLGFAAGAMAWMVVAELLPEARANASPGRVAVAVTVSFAAMTALQALLPR